MLLNVETSQKRQVVDITEAAITTADLDPGTDQDYLDAFEEIIPKLNYQHPHNPSHTPDHILSSFVLQLI